MDRPAEPIHAPRGSTISCQGWPQEAALRMLMNNLDPDVAERWQDLVVYGGSGKAARTWEAYHGIVAALRRLREDETLLVQSGKPVGVFRTHTDAPRVIIANYMFLGDGITHIPEMLEAGVRVGLGTDGGCTNNRLSVFEEMRMCSLLQRVRLLDGRALAAERAFRMGTAGAAEILGLETGTIAVGQLADLVALDVEDTSLHPRNDLLKNVVYAMSPRAITDVWVHGRRVVENRRLVTVDEGRLVARVRELTGSWRV